jgi:YggT family protein
LLGPTCAGASPLSSAICLLATLLTVAIIARALLSWFNMDPGSPLIQALNAITEPILEPIRRVMPRMGMLDLSPLVAIILLQIVAAVLASAVDGSL